MKTFKCQRCFILLCLTGIAAFNGRVHSQDTPENIMKNAVHLYKDGEYTGKSRAGYTDEPYWGIATITIKDGIFEHIEFVIRDSNLHEDFSRIYSKHFKGNALYKEQCRKDWGGVKKYPRELGRTQNIDDIDAISGATWSYNIFRASVKQALKNAYNEIATVPIR